MFGAQFQCLAVPPCAHGTQYTASHPHAGLVTATYSAALPHVLAEFTEQWRLKPRCQHQLLTCGSAVRPN